jgi:hypothetical protein
MTHLLRIYRRAASEFSSLQPVKLLAVRLYWDSVCSDRVGKLHNSLNITGLFASLNIAFPGLSAPSSPRWSSSALFF